MFYFNFHSVQCIFKNFPWDFFFDPYIIENCVVWVLSVWKFSFYLYYWFLVWLYCGQEIHSNFSSSKLVEICFMVQDLLYLIICSMGTWKQCIFGCLVECSINVYRSCCLMVLLSSVSSLLFLCSYAIGCWERGVKVSNYNLESSIHLSSFSVFASHIF